MLKPQGFPLTTSSRHSDPPHRPLPTLPCEILHNCTDAHPGQPSVPIDLEQVRDYLITKTNQQKTHHDKRYRAQPLSDLSPGQDVLFLRCTDQPSYLEGTILGPAHSPRSCFIEAQGHRHRSNREQFDLSTLTHHHLSQDHPHRRQEPDNNSVISGPSHISGPSTLPQSLGVIWSSKILQPDPLPWCPTPQECSQPHHCCLYTRQSTQVCNLFSGPSNTHF